MYTDVHVNKEVKMYVIEDEYICRLKDVKVATRHIGYVGIHVYTCTCTCMYAIYIVHVYMYM